jgi:type IV pilus assembly protein PilY1
MKKLSLCNTPSRRPSYRQILVGCAALGLSSSALAVCTATSTVACLADQPIQSTSTIKPNVMFVLDNSGSMVWDLMSQDSALSGTVNSGKYCRENFQYNTVYYNPNTNYTAAVPKDALNTSMGSQSFTSAKDDPFATSFTYSDLSLYTSAGFCAEGETASCSAPTTTAKNNYIANPTANPLPTTNYQPAFYYKYTGSGSPGTACSDNSNYTRVIVGASSCAVGGDVTACPTGADERVNFANWYSYFRTRILMMKSGMSTAFSTIDDKIRVGFHTINSPSSGNSSGRSLNIADFAATQKSNWYTALWSIAPSGGTPLQDALARVGNYYANSGTMTGLSGDPVQYSCQKNFTIMSTDGYWNSGATSVGDQDKTVPSTMPLAQGSTTYNATDTGLTAGAQFPRPYYEGSTASSDSLADVAMYYWVRDLRTSGSVSANNVPTTSSDPAYWQHMNTFTIGLGVNGTLTFPDDLAALTSGTKSWPTPAADSLTAVDDLWHAALNGRGQYYRATDPTSLSNSLNSALKAVTNVPTYGVGPATSTNNFRFPGQTDFSTYVASYRVINWSGDVSKYAVAPSSGTKSGSALWSAAYQLDSQVNPGLTSTVNATAFTTRNIVTRTEAGAAVAFTYPTLSSTQQTALCYKVAPGTGACVAGDTTLVDYLRGDAKWEGDYGVAATAGSPSRYRNRKDTTESTYYKRSLIGSIVNAGPAYVAAETNNYQETSDPGFTAFKAGTRSRAPTLYAPANDGMVHALDAATGNELWAYVPSFVIPAGNDTEGKEKGLRALSFQDSGAPAYSHHFYLDATPAVGAVDFARTGGPLQEYVDYIQTYNQTHTPAITLPTNCTTVKTSSGNWKNILVGGLGKGGKGYYALDVTTPATSLDNAKTKVLWEFPSAADSSHAPVISAGKMGYSFGEPVITKTNACGWVVMLPSGFNNTDGFGHVFVLDAQTGKLLETLDTTTTAPGMAYITPLAQANNKVAIQVYAGDLSGNAWRFDFGRTPLSPRVAQIFSSSASTPITSEVKVSNDLDTGDRWVFFGTGQYLDVPDRATTGQQYLVGLRDGTLSNPKTTGGAVTLASLTLNSNLVSGLASCPVLGWKFALPNSGERLTLAPVADLNMVAFGSLIPTTDPCSPGISGYLYATGYCKGQSVLTSGGSSVPSMYYAKGINGLEMQMTSDGTVQVKIASPDGTSPVVGSGGGGLNLPSIAAGTRHVGWRELLNEY